MDNFYMMVKRLNSNQSLMSKNGSYFVASQSIWQSILEVCVFHATEKGEITNWNEVEGHSGIMLIHFIRQFVNDDI